MTAVVAVLAVLVVAWFAGGTIWNVRRGKALMRWMQGGLPLVGERTTMRWLGTTAVELVIRKALPPFQQVAVVVFLEPRDSPWMWALGRRAGRRDTLILRAQLRSTPRADIEALDRSSWSGRDALRSLRSGDWSVREPASATELTVYYKTPGALARADALVSQASRAGLTVRRLCVRRTEPHLQLHLAPPPPPVSAAEFFQAIRALGERAPA